MVTRRKKPKTKAAKPKPSVKASAKKAKRPPAKTKRGVKAKAKRSVKALVKALKPARRKATRAKPAKKATHARGKHKNRVKLVRRKLSITEEMQVNALIARVYQKAAEEMRRLEDTATNAKVDLMQHAAQELVHLEDMAKKFKG